MSSKHRVYSLGVLILHQLHETVRSGWTQLLLVCSLVIFLPRQLVTLGAIYHLCNSIVFTQATDVDMLHEKVPEMA